MALLETDNPFWQFSLRVYAAPGVAGECLEIQDRLGVDVNILLYVAWLGATRGVTLDHADIARIGNAAADWSADVVQPLRAVRRKLKLAPVIGDPAVQALRKQVAKAELFSEQIEQALLYRLADAMSGAGTGSDAAVRNNVSALLAVHGTDLETFPLRRLFAASGTSEP